MALAMPGLAAYAQTADFSQSNAPAVPVVFRSDWTTTTNTSSDNPEEWTGRFDLDIIDWLCGYVPRRTSTYGEPATGDRQPAGRLAGCRLGAKRVSRHPHPGPARCQLTLALDLSTVVRLRS